MFSSVNVMFPKFTVPEASFVAVGYSGMGAPSSPVTVKLNLPAMLPGPVRPSGTSSIFVAARPMVADSAWYSFLNARPPSGYSTEHVKVPLPASVMLTVTLNELALAVMPSPDKPSVTSRAT